MLLNGAAGASAAGGAPASGDALQGMNEGTAAAAGTTKESDQVFCTVFGPNSAPPGGKFRMQAFAHLKGQAAELDARAAETYAAAPRRFGSEKSMGQKIERETDIFFKLEMEGLTVKNPEQTITWIGEIDWVTFSVAVPEDFKPGVVEGYVYYGVVSAEGERVERGHVGFDFTVAAEPAAQPAPAGASAAAPQASAVTNAEPAAGLARPDQMNVPHKRAFISYAHEEAEEVFKRIQGIEAAGVECLMDKTTFKTGEDWAAAIPRLIEESDVFYLCWSRKASKSVWVLKEIKLAMDKLEANRLKPTIRPLPLEPPSLVEPYKDLDSQHFDDPLLAFIDAERFRKLMHRLFHEEGAAAAPEAGGSGVEGDARQH